MRTAIVSYCNLGTGNELSGKLVLPNPLHPRLRSVFEQLYPMFEDIIINDHNLLSQETHREKFLQYLPNEEMRQNLRGKWPKRDSEDIESPKLWEQYKAEYKKFRTDTQHGQKRKDDLSIESLVMCYLYPRLDANVSTSINHLLKSPWCVHPKTGKSVYRNTNLSLM